MDDYLITVLMCVYNETESDLRCAIESILNQTFTEFEFLIIIDNPSRDDLIKIIYDYQKVDKRIRCIVNECNLGLPLSLNKGINLSKTDLIARMDADDYSESNRLEIQYSIFNNDDSIALVASNCNVIDETGKLIYTPSKLPTEFVDIKKTLSLLNIIIHPSVMYKKSIIQSVGMYRNIKSCEDYDLWLRLINLNYKIKITNKRLIKYRKRNNSISNSNLFRQYLTVEFVKEINKKVGYIDISLIEAKLEEYLERKKCYDKKCANRFVRGFIAKEKIKPALNRKNFLVAFYYLLIAFFSSELSRSNLIENIISNKIKQKAKMVE